MKTLIVVDGQNDFISGSLACANGQGAMENLVNFIEANPEMTVYYTADWHSRENGSFKRNGGIWPVHCVAGTEGAMIYEGFHTLKNKDQRANNKTIFLKGKDDEVEEYSGSKGENALGEVLEEVVQGEILIAGLASEYCVRETLLELKEQGNDVALYLPGVGYVDEEDHKKNIQDLKDRNIPIIE